MKESRNLEFKEDITNTFLKTVSAFSNYDGGKIIFGINDQGSVVGVNDPEKGCLDIENKINDSIRPQPDYTLEVTEEKTIILEIYAGNKKPYLYKSKAYKRNDTATIEADTLEVTRLILEGRNRSYEELPSDVQNLNFSILEDKLIRETGIDSCDTNILKTLNLYSDETGYNIAAAILADENIYPGIDIGRFGESISIIKTRKTFQHCSALALYDSACEMFNDYYEYDVIEGTTRKTVKSIPEEAFRETIANALIHRVWDVKEHIRIFMFEDRIEVFSPGGLPARLSKDAYLSGNYSNLRNPILSNVFYRLKIVEIFGTGIRRIKEAYLDSITKPEFEVYDNQIKVILPILEAKNTLQGDEAVVYEALSEVEGKAMSEILKSIPFGKSKTRIILQDLVSRKLVYVKGSGRGTKYYRM